MMDLFVSMLEDKVTQTLHPVDLVADAVVEHEDEGIMYWVWLVTL